MKRYIINANLFFYLSPILIFIIHVYMCIFGTIRIILNIRIICFHYGEMLNIIFKNQNKEDLYFKVI